jgi:DNA-binding transcriptional LysR family regulator
MDNTKRPAISELAWEDVRVFLAVLEAGSINQAAPKLGLGQATVSRRLAILEAQLGHALFVRGVAGVTPTPLAEQMSLPAKRMAESATEVSQAAAFGKPQVAGVVRVTAPPLMCVTLLVQFAARLRRLHPLITLEIQSGVRFFDLARGEADLAVRTVQDKHGDLVSVARVSHDNHIYGSPALVKKLKPPFDFATLPWLAWSREYAHMPPNPQLSEFAPGFTPVFTSDDFLVLVHAAEAGVGLIPLAAPIVRLLGRSSLVPLDVSLGPYKTSETHVVATASALRLPKVRAVADALGAYTREVCAKEGRR